MSKKILASMLALAFMGFMAFAEEAQVFHLPQNLVTIEEEAFANIDIIEKVVVPEGAVSIGPRAFANSSLGEIELPLSVSFIAEDAFEGCDNLTAKVVSGSTAYEFCREHNIPMEVVNLFTPFDDFVFSYITITDEYGNTRTIAYVDGYTGTDSVVRIPDYIGDGIQVCEINGSAFAGNTTIEHIVIPDTVTNIGDWAFKDCTNLKSVKLPGMLESISNSAFEGCTALCAAVLPESTFVYKEDEYSYGDLTIGSAAFKNCTALETLIVRRHMDFSTVTNGYHAPAMSLGASCFEGCSNLKNVELSYTGSGYYTAKGGVYVRESAFKNCSSLLYVILDGADDYWDGIGASAFENCISLKSFSATDAIDVGKSTFKNCRSLESLSATIRDVGAHAFEGCSSLSSISAGSIGEFAFAGCIKLQSANIGSSIGESAFEGCASLASLTRGSDGLSTGQTASEGGIGKNAFAGCVNLARPKLGYDIAEIGEGAFRGCAKLEHIILPDANTVIGENAFEGCNIQATVYAGSPAEAYMLANDIPHDVIRDQFRISYLDESRCSLDACGGSNPDVVVPERFGPYTVTKLGKDLVNDYNRNNINTLTLPDTITEVASKALPDSSSLPLIFRASSTTGITLHEYYKNSYYGLLFRSPSHPSLVIRYIKADGVLSKLKIHDYDGEDTTVTIPSEIDGVPVSYIDTYGYNWNGVTDVFIGSGISILKTSTETNKVFSGCETLTNVTFLGDVPKIEGYTFSNCPSLKSVTIMGDISELGKAFNESTALEKVIFKGNVGSISDYAFYECSGLKTLSFGGDVGSIGNSAFAYCDSLKTLTFGGSAASIGSSAFSRCSSLNSVVLPSGNPSIGNSAFYMCNLRTITIPDGWTTLPTNVFYQSTKPEMVLIPTSVTSIADNAFGAIYTRDETPVVYCKQYSVAQTWATGKDLPVVLMDGKTFADYGRILVPESLRMPVGEKTTLEARPFPYDAALKCTWSSSAPEIISVDSNGSVTVNAQGEAVITVSAGGVSAEIAVSTYLPITDFALSAEEITLAVGTTTQLTIQSLTPAESTAGFGWGTDNDLLATVDSGLVSALAIGDTVISCTAENGLTRSCTVHIVAPS